MMNCAVYFKKRPTYNSALSGESCSEGQIQRGHTAADTPCFDSCFTYTAAVLREPDLPVLHWAQLGFPFAEGGWRSKTVKQIPKGKGRWQN